MSANLVVREYDHFRIGARWNAADRCISQEAANLLARFQERNGRELVRLGHQRIQATNWVGTLGVGRHCIEVLPKIDDPHAGRHQALARKNLLWMLARSGQVPASPADLVRLDKCEAPLLLAFMTLYVEKLALEWRRGPIRDYVVDENNRPFLRGKLLPVQQLRVNLIQRQRFFTACDEFSPDNPLSQVLKAALRACATQSFSVTLAGNARGLLGDFDLVSDVEPATSTLEGFAVDRRHQRFAPLLALARLILRSRSPESGGDGEQVYSLMFDMNEVFEKFIAAEMQAALAGSDLNVVPQLSGRSLLKQGNRSCFHLRPDIGIMSRSRVVCLIDTKWKRLDPSKPHAGVSQADIYQMYAYGKEYDAPRTLLLYPATKDACGGIGRYFHHEEGMAPRCIEICTVDICQNLCDLAATENLRMHLSNMALG